MKYYSHLLKSNYAVYEYINFIETLKDKLKSINI